MTARVLQLHPAQLEPRGRATVLKFRDDVPSVIIDLEGLAAAIDFLQGADFRHTRVRQVKVPHNLVIEGTKDGCRFYVHQVFAKHLSWAQCDRLYNQTQHRLQQLNPSRK